MAGNKRVKERVRRVADSAEKVARREERRKATQVAAEEIARLKEMNSVLRKVLADLSLAARNYTDIHTVVPDFDGMKLAEAIRIAVDALRSPAVRQELP